MAVLYLGLSESEWNAKAVVGGNRPWRATFDLVEHGSYTGLWESARAAKPLDRERIQQLPARFVEQATIPKLTDTMVRIDERLDALKTLQKSKWGSKKEAASGSLLLSELLAEVGRSEAAAQPEKFQKFLGECAQRARELNGALGDEATVATIDGRLQNLVGSCTACHRVYRDSKSP